MGRMCCRIFEPRERRLKSEILLVYASTVNWCTAHSFLESKKHLPLLLWPLVTPDMPICIWMRIFISSRVNNSVVTYRILAGCGLRFRRAEATTPHHQELEIAGLNTAPHYTHYVSTGLDILSNLFRIKLENRRTES